MIFKIEEVVERNPQILGGVPVVKGTRVPLKTVLASLADGDSIEDIVSAFPSLSESQVRAVIRYAAKAVEEDIPFLVSAE